ncbi:MAG: S49 family peptidase [Zoogloeaceae bacterium]|jgi:protease-4|nr:S49 family peptidase [Zoogloeaceae bacterium]
MTTNDHDPSRADPSAAMAESPSSALFGLPEWERRTLEKLVFAALEEQRARRRWGIFFKLAGLLYITIILLSVMDHWSASRGVGQGSGGKKHTAIIQVQGVIDATSDASAQKINAALRRAFADENTAGIVLRINSPGGSPVQAGIIHDEMKRLRQKYPKKPLYAVVEDLCASGGYYVAAGAERIYVNRASLVGSIGVLMNGFGFTGAMEKLGIERRLLTAGENKGFLDPFSPMKPEQKAHIETLLQELHQQFIAVVREGRGERLKETPETFSGLVWSGETSIRMGLADELGTVDSVARDVLKTEKLVDFSVKENFAERFSRLLGQQAGASFGQGVADAVTSGGLR